jgi:hypothetical protein
MRKLLAAAIVLLVAQAGWSKRATPIDEPTVITAPGAYVLVADITAPSDAPAIEIRADDVDLDLGGRTIFADDEAIVIEPERTRIAIHDGSIVGPGNHEGFTIGVSQRSTSGLPIVVIRNVDFVDLLRAGVIVSGAGYVEVSDSTMLRVATSVSTSSRAARIADNEILFTHRPAIQVCDLEAGNITGNVITTGFAPPAEKRRQDEKGPNRLACEESYAMVKIFRSSNLLISRNSVTGGYASSGGISADRWSRNLRISHNELYFNFETGIAVSSNNRIINNTLRRCGDDDAPMAIWVDSYNVIRGNTVIGSIGAIGEAGIYVYGERNLIDSNRVTDFYHYRGAGLRFHPWSFRNLYRNNMLLGNIQAVDDQGSANVDGGGNVME